MMDYRIEFSRQNLKRNATLFAELQIKGPHDPAGLHRRISQRVTALGYQILDENLGIVKRPIGTTIGDVFGILHAGGQITVPHAGIVAVGLLNRHQRFGARLAQEIRVAQFGETQVEQGPGTHADLSVIVGGRIDCFAQTPAKYSGIQYFPELLEAQALSRTSLAHNVKQLIDFLKAEWKALEIESIGLA